MNYIKYFCYYSSVAFLQIVWKTTPRSDDDIVISVETLINGVILEKIGVHGCPFLKNILITKKYVK